MRWWQGLMLDLLDDNTLRRFQWYRRHVGGVWDYSFTLGWRHNPVEEIANLVVFHAKQMPELYSNGRDVEDYRTREEGK